MNKKDMIWVFLLVIAGFRTASAQSTKFDTHETEKVDIFLLISGPSFLFGEAGGSFGDNYLGFTDLDFSNVRPTLSFGLRQMLNSDFGVRLTMSYGMFSGSDEDSRNQKRSISYVSNAFQTHLTAEYAFLRARFSSGRLLKSYIFAGAGFIASKAEVQNFRPTDKIKESEFAPAIPAGLGMELQLSNTLFLGVEGNVTYYHSDFIDGIQSPYYSKSNDVSANILFTLFYRVYEGRFWERKRPCHCVWD